MSTFSCPIVHIASVSDHPNADRLSIVTVLGYHCVTAKLPDGSHRYNVNDFAIYIPEDSILPEPILRQMGFWKDGKGTLAGAEGNRVKACKLRGVLSQGLLFPLSSTLYCKFDDNVRVGDDASELLGITKYVPPIPQSMSGEVDACPFAINFDVENIKRWPTVIRNDELVVVTEKIHGTLMAVVLTNTDVDDETECYRSHGTYTFTPIKAFVSSKGLLSKRLFLKDNGANKNNVYVRTFHRLNKTHETVYPPNVLIDAFDHMHRHEPTTMFILGELYGKGIQDLHYDGISEQNFRVFKIGYIEAGETRYLSRNEMEIVANAFGLAVVPILDVIPYDLSRVETLASGNSALGTNIKEGVVIEPLIPRRDPSIGNVWLKAISPAYIDRKNGTEYT